VKTAQIESVIIVLADSTHQKTIDAVSTITGNNCALIIADPPYGNIVSDKWDKSNGQKSHANWMISWVQSYGDILLPGAAMYVWGGVGRPGDRPLYEFLSRVEDETSLNIANHITWSKKRAYGVQHNYLFTREELIYLTKGDIKKPRIFNVPYLDVERGYSGFNKKYPAKSIYKRRTNVWTDVTEIMRGKLHTAQKPIRLAEILIETHTRQNEWIIDPFSGSGTTGVAALKLGRRAVLIENDEASWQLTVSQLNGSLMNTES